MNDTVLIHHGIKGQRWGIRRFQNEDGTRTAAGRRREQANRDGVSSSSGSKKGLTDRQKKALKTAAVVAGAAVVTGLAVYGAYKYSDAIKTEAWNQTVRKGEAALRKANEDTRFWEESAAKYAGMSEERIKAGHDAINQMGIDSINETAKYNSSSFRNAVKTLRGEGLRSTPENDAEHIYTVTRTKDGDFTEGRRAWENALQKELVKAGYGYAESNTKNSSSKSIFGPKK